MTCERVRSSPLFLASTVSRKDLTINEIKSAHIIFGPPYTHSQECDV
jgi:hypothetical protein